MNATDDVNKDTPAVSIHYMNIITMYSESINLYAGSNNLIQFAADHLIFTQMGMKAGIRAFGQDGVNAVMKEM